MGQSLVEKALVFALLWHNGQKRKVQDIPFIVHPVMCMQLLAQHGYDEITLASALVHDVLEDTPCTEEDLKSELGDEVALIVSSVTEEKTLPWGERKEAYALSVAGGDEKVCAVSLADKLHNVRSILAEEERLGDAVWNFFPSGAEASLRFFERMLAVYKEFPENSLQEEYAQAVMLLRKTLR
jgi:(p)ppGpp synthase/HD superfamily hydrolase